jgi:gliding motility-associated-like protein
VQAQLSKKHFIPPLTYAESGNANPEDQYFYISTPNSQNVNFTIKQIGVPSADITGSVSKTSPQEIFIGNGDSQLFVDSRQTSLVHTNKGYIIESNDVIYVSIRVLAGGGAQAGALVSKGASALGTTFRAGMFTNENPQTNYLNFISVMASEDDTKVTFDDLPTGISIKNYPGSIPISITLNEGESYIVATNAADTAINRDGLIGALITSDKPIVTNIGSANGSFHNGGGRDYGMDQIVGIDKIGSEYIFVKGDGNDGWENVLIVAHEDNTTIEINGGSVFDTLDKGEHRLIEGNEFNADGIMFVKTSKPVFAYQGIGGLGTNGGPSEANQGLFFVPPLSCENRGKVDNIPTIESIGSVTFSGGITIVTNKGETVNINSQPIANFTTSGPFNVDGNTDYVTYKVTNLTGNISIDSSGELYCAYFNQNGAATSGSFYSGFPSSPEINFDTTVAALGNCIPNITLEAANTALFDEFEWFFDDETGGGFISTGNANAAYKPTNSGRYKLIGKINCSGATFESLEIPVSICPDDYDRDTIIDNLDADIDNDGILNCDESIGNAIINIVDIDYPSIVFQDSSINNSTISLYSETENSNSFSGDNLGNFESIINPAIDTKLKYELKFNQNINLKFTQNKTANHIISADEFFILKIGPNNKNITLLDPDNQLLIDTNFDGIFETGITEISASEIHFKYVVNTTGATSTFEFVANQIDQIDFKHQSAGITTPSTFHGNIQLTCFSRDSDGDGIEDMFDLDSDNDGIPDFNETDNDTDGDLIANYLDVDADNDGIYDLVEAGHNLTDANQDGIIDNANATFGINGLVDDLEITPDDKILAINYTIADTDADRNFNFLELDSDNDGCNDVIEAGFTGNGLGKLSPNSLDVDDYGRVKNSDGYETLTNDNYINGAPIIINTPFIDVTFCENDTNTISIDSNADTFQWEVFDGTIWLDISDNALYSGSTTKSLMITNVPTSINTKYRVKLNLSGNTCGDISNEITLTVNPKPVILNSIVQLNQCADNAAEITTVNLTEAEINISTDKTVSFEYYETEAKAILGGVSNRVSNKEKHPVNKTASAWVRIVSDKTCYTISRINVTASFAGDINYNKIFEECDDFIDENGNDSNKDGVATFDFSSAAQDIKNSLSFTDPFIIDVFFYETPEDRDAATHPILDITKHRNNGNASFAFDQTIYIKIKNKNNDCEGIGKLFLKTSKIPEFTVDGEAPNNPIIICTKNIPYTLEVKNPQGTYDYKWSEKSGTPIPIDDIQNIPISHAGEYTVTAYSRDTKTCSQSRTISVQKSNFDALDESFVTIKDDTSASNSNLSIQIEIPINPLINEEFQYALENENGILIRNLQDSNIFNNIDGGVYNIIVENKNGCGTSELIVSVIQFPKFFTPNGDGENDTWGIKGANKILYPNSSINIFNRFGKLVAQVPIDSQSWNGTYNGQALPSDDYWFYIQLIPADASKSPILKKGHFSLLRK